MSDFIGANSQYWNKGYHSPNVDSYVFRFYGRILRDDFNMPNPDKNTSLLDFGCGQGAAVNYFNELGFTAFGCDNNINDIKVAKEYFPKSSQNFHTIPSDTTEIISLSDSIGVTDKFDVITSFQTLYYLPKAQFEHFTQLAYDSLKKGGIFFATMI